METRKPPLDTWAVVCRFSICGLLAPLPLSCLVAPCIGVPLLIVLSCIFFAGGRRGARTSNFGSARFANYGDLAAGGLLEEDGLILGRVWNPPPGRWQAIRGLFTLSESADVCRNFSAACLPRRWAHRPQESTLIRAKNFVSLMTVAPAGEGKGVGAIIPNLLTYPGSVVVTDPKGENFGISSAKRRRGMGHTIACVDPFGVTKAKSVSINPLLGIVPESPSAVDDGLAIADALVIRTGHEQDQHWNDNAALLLQALILFVCTGKPEERNLDLVRTLLTDFSALQGAVKLMKSSNAYEGILQRLAGQISTWEGRELSSILSTAQRHTAFLDSPRVRASLRSDNGNSVFDPRSLLTDKVSLFLILPPEYLRSQAALMRLWLTTIVMAMFRNGEQKKRKVLFMLDEVGQLGKLRSLQDAVTIGRGFGCRMWFFFQSFFQVRECFPEGDGQILLSNIGHAQFFGINDLETAERISKMLGMSTIQTVTRSTNESTTRPSLLDIFSSNGKSGGTQVTRGTSESFSETGRSLLMPDEVMRLPSGQLILFAKGQDGTPVPPVIAGRIRYYNDPEFQDPPREKVQEPFSPRIALSVAGACLFFFMVIFGAGAVVPQPRPVNRPVAIPQPAAKEGKMDGMKDGNKQAKPAVPPAR